MLHALRRLERTAAIGADDAAEAVDRLGQLPIARYPTAGLTGRAWSLRHNFTAYDAMYVALAEAVGTRLVTSDERLASAAREHSAVEVVLVG